MPTTAETPASYACTFTLVSLNILNIRSPHKDTDYASFTIRINPQTIDGRPATGPAQTVISHLGNLGTGSHPVNLSFSKIGVDSTDSVVVNYLILNSSTNPAKVESALRSSADRLSSVLGAVTSLAQLSLAGAVINEVKEAVSFVLDTFHAIFGTSANCDGTVAAEQAVIACTDLLSNTANGNTWTRTTTHPDTDSPKGCGKNSVYEVTWTSKQDASLTPVKK